MMNNTAVNYSCTINAQINTYMRCVSLLLLLIPPYFILSPPPLSLFLFYCIDK